MFLSVTNIIQKEMDWFWGSLQQMFALEQRRNDYILWSNTSLDPGIFFVSNSIPAAIFYVQ